MTMFLTIYAPGMPFNGETIPSGKSLGGSESAAYYMAQSLEKLGHTITVFTSHPETGNWGNVRYEWIGDVSKSFPLGRRYMFACQSPTDVIISQRHPLSFAFRPNSKLNIWWLHDLAQGRMSPHIQENLLNTDAVLTVSEFHRKQVAKTWGVDLEKIIATQNGVDYGDPRKPIASGYEDRKENTVLFASRPERGLEGVIELANLMPHYTFMVAGYDNTLPQMKDYYQYLFSQCDLLPNIQVLGHLGKEELWRVMGEVMALIYPTTFEDTSNMLCLEAAAQGTPFIGPEIAALPETASGGFAKLIPLVNGRVDIPAFMTAIESLCEEPLEWNNYHEAAIVKYQSWDNIACDWDEIFKSLLAQKSLDGRRNIIHLEQMSDIQAMREIYPEPVIAETLNNFHDDYYFLFDGVKMKDHYANYYAYERKRGVTYGPEVLDGNHRFEFVSSVIAEEKPRDVLDYGCAHGHYTINLAKRFPKIGFIGIDIEESNIKTANKWKKEEKIDNVIFRCKEHHQIQPELKFDLIILAEILEHVEDPIALVKYLHDKHLANDGLIVITVPYGPWEAIGYRDNPGWRAHIHHFERQDLFEMFGEKKDYRIASLPHGNDLGHFVVRFRKSPAEFGKIDYSRKMKMLAPRETVSLCMIVKDEADSILRCLNSIAPWVDEVIIAIDCDTTDSTDRVIHEYPEAVTTKFKVYFQDSPLNIGFDVARNRTISQAESDWILWLDADETLENPSNLWKYLRSNHFNGYVIPQHHFSCEPAQLLQTDLPVRLFRNNQDIRFFGMVHEHPSQAEDINEGPGNVYHIKDISIAHLGYATEAKRRGRFRRNYPLMIKDRKKYPDRVLGKYLFVRDLCHDIKYRLELNRGQFDNVCMALAQELVELYEKMIREDKPKYSKYFAMALPYYSDGVRMLTNGNGIPFRFAILDNKIEGVFRDPDTLLLLIQKMAEDPLSPFKLEYF